MKQEESMVAMMKEIFVMVWEIYKRTNSHSIHIVRIGHVVEKIGWDIQAFTSKMNFCSEMEENLFLRDLSKLSILYTEEDAKKEEEAKRTRANGNSQNIESDSQNIEDDSQNIESNAKVTETILDFCTLVSQDRYEAERETLQDIHERMLQEYGSLCLRSLIMQS